MLWDLIVLVPDYCLSFNFSSDFYPITVNYYLLMSKFPRITCVSSQDRIQLSRQCWFIITEK